MSRYDNRFQHNENDEILPTDTREDFSNTLTRQDSVKLLSNIVGAASVQSEADTVNRICQLLKDNSVGLELIGCYLRENTTSSFQDILSTIVNSKNDQKELNTVGALHPILELVWNKLDNHTQLIAVLLGGFPAECPIRWSSVHRMFKKLESDEQYAGFNCIYNSAEVEKSGQKLIEFGLMKPIDDIYLLSSDTRSFFSINLLVRNFSRAKAEDSK